MRPLLIVAALAVLVCWATPAEAKFVFRDGKWIFVPDDEELPPKPQVAKPPAKPTPAPPVEPPVTDPAPPEPTQPVDTAEPSQPVQPVETPAPQPAPPMQPDVPHPAPAVEAPQPAAAEGPTETRLEFRDGKWVPVRVPVKPKDTATAPPAEVASPLAVESPDEPRPETSPAPVPPVDTAMPAIVPPSTQPATAEGPMETRFEFRGGKYVPVRVPVKSAVAGGMPSEVAPPLASDSPVEPRSETPLAPDMAAAEREPAEPAVEAPHVEPAALAVADVPSVGDKYRTPQPGQAADEVAGLIASIPPSEGNAVKWLNEAVEAYRKSEYGTVISRTEKLLGTYRHSRFAEGAKWLLAESIFAEGDYYKAWTEYEEFVKVYAGSPLVDKALVRQFEAAEALLGPARRKVLGVPLSDGNDEAVAILEKIYAHRPTGPLAPDAIFRLAEHDIAGGRYAEAETMLQKFLDEFPNHSRARQAELLSAKCAMAAHGGPEYDDSSLKRAEDTLLAYRAKYPEMAAQENVDGALERIRRQRAERRVEQAAYYQRAQRDKAARYYADLVVRQYPGTPAADRARAILNDLGQP